MSLSLAGKQETGTRLAEFCAHALLALEVLIHPRALPLADFSLGNSYAVEEGLTRNFTGSPFPSFQKQNTPFPSSSLGLDEHDLDDLYKSWLGNGEEAEAPVNKVDKNTEDSPRPSERHTIGPSSTEMLAADNSVSTMNVDDQRIRRPTETIDAETPRSTDEVMLTAEKSQVPNAISDVGTVGKSVVVSARHSGSKAIESTKIASDNIGDSNKNVSAPSNIVTDTGASPSKGIISDTYDSSATGKPFSLGNSSTFEHNSDTDSIPDIVDADPDSEDDL